MKYWRAYALIITLFFISCKNNSSSPNSNQNFEEIEILDEPKDEILIQTIKMGEDSSSFRFLASFPETRYDFINEIENQFAQDFLSEFKKVSSKYKDSINLKNNQIDYHQNFDVLQKNDKVLTLLINRYSTDGKNSTKQFFTHYFDLLNEKQLNPEFFFKDFNSLKEFSNYTKSIVSDDLKNIIKKAKITSPKAIDSINSLVASEIEPIPENYKNIIKLPNGNWKFIFDKYNIPVKDNEVISVIIPAEKMNRYLNPEFLNLMDSESPLEEEKVEVVYNEDNIDCGKVPCVALTFDDGPSAYTPKLLDILKENNVKATFFVLGKSAKIQKNTLQRAFEEGHEIENHTWDHKNLVKLTNKQIKEEVEKTDSILVELIGQKSTYLRPPYGSFNKRVRSEVEKPYILWTIDPLDWKVKNTQIITEKLSEAEAGMILLAHDTHKETIDAIPQVIKNLKAKGLHFVTVKKLLEGKELKNGKTYRERE